MEESNQQKLIIETKSALIAKVLYLRKFKQSTPSENEQEQNLYLVNKIPLLVQKYETFTNYCYKQRIAAIVKRNKILREYIPRTNKIIDHEIKDDLGFERGFTVNSLYNGYVLVCGGSNNRHGKMPQGKLARVINNQNVSKCYQLLNCFHQHACVVIWQNAYLLGSYDQKHSNYFERFNWKTGQSENLPPMPNTVDRHSACLIDENTIMTFGGCCGGGKICRYKIQERQWTVLKAQCGIQNFTTFYLPAVEAVLYFGGRSRCKDNGFDLKTGQEVSLGKWGFKSEGRIVVTSPVKLKNKLFLWNTYCQLQIFDLEKKVFLVKEIENNDLYFCQK